MNRRTFVKALAFVAPTVAAVTHVFTEPATAYRWTPLGTAVINNQGDYKGIHRDSMMWIVSAHGEHGIASPHRNRPVVNITLAKEPRRAV